MRISDWSSDVCASDLRERARQLESDMKKMVLLAISAAGFLAGCERAPTFPEILMTYHDVDWLKTHEDQIPVIVAECDKIVNSELKQSDLPMPVARRSEEHTSELQSLMRISYAVFCLKKQTTLNTSLIHLNRDHIQS